MKFPRNSSLQSHRFLLPVLFLLLFVGMVVAVSAQEATPAAAPVDGEVTELTLLSMFKLGGWSMYPLALCSIAGIGLGIYNAINLRPVKFLRPDLFDQLKVEMRALNVEGAKTLCEENPAPLCRITHAGLDRLDGDEWDMQSVEKGMEEAAIEEVANNLSPINYLSIIAVISPMLGLLGTVSGMIKAFQNMAALGMGRPELLAQNISEALVTTASGLIVGIPVMILYFYFKNRYTSMIGSLNRMAGELVERLKQSFKKYQRDGVLPAQAESVGESAPGVEGTTDPA